MRRERGTRSVRRRKVETDRDRWWSGGMLVGGAVALGLATGGGVWRICYHQSDAIRRFGTVLVVLLVAFGFGVTIGVVRSLRGLLGAAVLTGVVGLGAYWWLVGNTGATRCAWYRPVNRAVETDVTPSSDLPTGGRPATPAEPPTTGPPTTR